MIASADLAAAHALIAADQRAKARAEGDARAAEAAAKTAARAKFASDRVEHEASIAFAASAWFETDEIDPMVEAVKAAQAENTVAVGGHSPTTCVRAGSVIMAALGYRGTKFDDLTNSPVEAFLPRRRHVCHPVHEAFNRALAAPTPSTWRLALGVAEAFAVSERQGSVTYGLDSERRRESLGDLCAVVYNGRELAPRPSADGA